MRFVTVSILLIGSLFINISLGVQGDKIKAQTLHQAAVNGDIETAKQLISKGANVNQKAVGGTPLHMAAERGHKDIVELLIQNGAEVNAKGTQNWTPLHLAATAGKQDVVEFLISKGADVNAMDLDGHTPLWWAQIKQQNQIVILLKKHGAQQQISTRTVNNRTRQRTLETPQQTPPPNIDINTIKNIDPLKDPNAVKARLSKFADLDDELKKLETASQTEIDGWNDGLTECSTDIILTVYGQIGAEFDFVRKQAVEGNAEKTTAAIDGVLLKRQERFEKIVEKMEENAMRRDLLESRRGTRGSRRSTRGRTGAVDGTGTMGRPGTMGRTGTSNGGYSRGRYLDNTMQNSRRRSREDMINRPSQPKVTLKLPFTDPNKVKASIKKFEGLEKELTAIDRMGIREMRGWTRSEPQTSPILAKAVYEQVAAEHNLVRKLAVGENAAKTTVATDGLLVTRQERLARINMAMLQEKKRLREEQRTDLRTGQRTSRIRTR